MDFEPRNIEESIELILRDMEDLEIAFTNFLNKRTTPSNVFRQIDLVKHNIENLKELV